MKVLRMLAISGAMVAALLTGGTAAPASADAFSSNAYGSVNFQSSGDYITLTHYTYDPYPGFYALLRRVVHRLRPDRDLR